MRRSLRGWTIAWVAACAGFLAYLFVAFGTNLVRNLEEDESTAICCMGPVWFCTLVATGVKLWGRWAFARRRAHAPVVGTCTACGYDTTGLTGLCPECGSPVETAAWVPRPEPWSRWSRSTRRPTRKRLRGWTVLWAVGLAGFVAYLIMAFGTHLLHNLRGWDSGAACFLIPVWFLVLVATGFELSGLWRFQLRRSRQGP